MGWTLPELLALPIDLYEELVAMLTEEHEQRNE
jgi:hypothetical protein